MINTVNNLEPDQSRQREHWSGSGLKHFGTLNSVPEIIFLKKNIFLHLVSSALCLCFFLLKQLVGWILCLWSCFLLIQLVIFLDV